MKHIIPHIAFVFSALYGFPVFALDPATTLGFESHKAVYEIALVETRSGSKVSNISGQMIYSWQPACEGWVASNEFDLTYEYIDSPAVKIQSNYATFEPFGGESFQYASKRNSNGTLSEELRGDVLSQDGLKHARFVLPSDLVIDLPEGVQFPMHHTLEVVERAKRGDQFYHAKIFDGSDTNGALAINAFLGKPVSLPEDLFQHPQKIDQALLSKKAWDVRLAFFQETSREENPEYEMNVLLMENGVVGGMHIDYENFSVRQSLIGLEKQPSLCF